MKRLKKVWLGVLLVGYSVSVRPDVRDTLNFYVSHYGLATLLPSVYFFDLNRSAAVLRTSLQATYQVGNLFGGPAYEQLQKEYLYPAQGAVPVAVRAQLEYFNTVQVTSSEVPFFNPQHPLRKDVDLGRQEKEFLKARLAYARRLFQTPAQGTFFKAPDTDLTKNSTPYGYALDIPLAAGAEVPRIATCFSGGGFRAMVATLGFWQAASDMGTVDSILYTANLSGSTWCSIPWCIGASLRDLKGTYKKFAKVSVGVAGYADLKKYILPALQDNHGITYVQQKFMSAFLWEQPLSSVRGMYGPLIGQMTLACWDDDALRQELGTKLPQQSSQYIYLWQAMDTIKDGTTRPFPLATALIPYEGNWSEKADKIAQRQKSNVGIWMEFNPESVGFEYFTHTGNLTGIWIPGFALGRKFSPVQTKKWYDPFNIFDTAEIQGYASEAAAVHTVDYWEGTWGSAFTVSPSDVYRIFYSTELEHEAATQSSNILKKLGGYLGTAVSESAKMGAKLSGVSNVRLFPAIFNNFAVGKDSPIQAATFTAVDAGIDFNVPLPPLLRQARGIDLIIVGDWSRATPLEPAIELCRAEKWARARGIPFPKIATSRYYKATVGKQRQNTFYNPTIPMILFNEYDEGQTGPAILYIPLMDTIFEAAHFNVERCFAAACSTFNFNYFQGDRDTVEQLSEHVYRTMWGVYPQLRQVVQKLVIAKNQNRPFTMTMEEMTPLIQVEGSGATAAA